MRRMQHVDVLLSSGMTDDLVTVEEDWMVLV